METINKIKELIPPAVAAAEALTDDFEPLEDPDETSSLWDRYLPTDVPFFKLALLDPLYRRPYHTVTLEGPFKLKQLGEDHREHIFRSEKIMDRSGNLKIDRLLLRLEGEGFGYLEGNLFKIYAPTPAVAQAAAQKFRRYVKPQPVGKPYYYVISVDQGGANAQKIYINRPLPVTTEELALHYGEDFPTWEKQWRDRLYRASSGLTILHGPPGCGKTYFLRAIAARLIDKAAIYVIPLSEVELLTNPNFVGFWIDQSQRHQKKLKIVILEDAEELLLPRDAGNRDRVSNLLNVADGFLSDHLRIQVIATTNAQIGQLDKAIIRPGRLIGAREFRRLTRGEAQRLAEAKGLTLPEQKDFSLAEVYNGAVNDLKLNGGRRIGFAQ